MAMTTTQQTDAYRFFIIAFGAAPGVEYMSQIAEAYGAGMTTKQIVNIYTTKPQFLEIYPSFYTNAQFADKLIENVVGSSATNAAKAEAKADVAAALAAGWTQGDVVYQIFTNLANKSLSDPQWGNTAKLLANQVAVAKYYTEEMLGNTTDLSQLREIVDGVTHTTDVSTPAAIAQFIEDATSAPAPTYELAANHASVNEGTTVLFTLTTTNVAAGTTFAYTITGVDAADVVGGSLTGVATVDALGKAVIAVSLTEDATTEGAEAISLSVAGQTATSAVVDTSLTPDAILTTGNDLVALGVGDDTIIGNSATYNSGDEINGGEGSDTLKLDLLSSNTPYDVGNVNNVEQLFVRTLEVVDGETNTNPEVTLLLTNYEGLETLNIDRSRADITVEDLQGGVDVVINDVRGDVTIGFDQQNVPAAVNVSIREFGQTATGAAGNSDFQDEADTDGAAQDDEADANKAHDFGGHAADLTIDAGVATVNLTDAGTEGFESDLSIAGGFSTLNILGGQDDAGMDLTIHDVNSSAFVGYGEDGVTVNATAYAGDLSIDADGINVLNTGVGDDVITTDMSYGGDIDAGEGDNRVTIGSLVGEDVWNNDNLDAGGSITTGSGVDVVRVDNDASGSISTGAGNDTVEIGANLAVSSGLDEGINGRGDLEADGTIDTGAGSDTVAVRDDVFGDIDTGSSSDVAADGDTVEIGDDVGQDSDITTGAGADDVHVGGDMAGTITTGSEADHVQVAGNVGGVWNDAAAITTEGGDDLVEVTGILLDDSVISTGDDNDKVEIKGGVQNAQDTTAPDADTDAQINLGAGNDELQVRGNMNGDIDAGAGDDDILIANGSVGNNNVTVATIAGGEGSDSLTLLDNSWDSEGTDVSLDAEGVGQVVVTGVETLNLVDEEASNGSDFNINLGAFDNLLATVNIAKFGEGNSEVNLYNVAGEQISITAEDNVVLPDVTLNVTSAASSLAVSLESDIQGGIHNEDDVAVDLYGEDSTDWVDTPVAAGNTDFDVVINDDSTTPIADLNLANNGEAASDDVVDGYEKGRTVTLDGEDFDGTLTITGDMTNDRAGYAESDDLRRLNQQDGNLLLVSGIAADTINASTYAGDLNLVLADDESHTITLGGGDDVVNLLGDTLDVGDNIDFGAGVDRLIVNEDTQTTGDDSDEVFGDLVGLEELEVRGSADGVLNVSLDDDALRSDIERVIVDADGEDDANVLLDIGADWENRDLRVDVFNGQVEINNDSSNNLTVFTDALVGGRDITIDNNDGGTSEVFIGIGTIGATIASGDAYVYADYTEDAENANFGYGSNGEVELDAQTGVITQITLLDNHGGENGGIEVTVADAWAKGGSLTIDASDISNDNIGANSDNNGGLTLRGGMEDDATLTVIGTDNDDKIMGGTLGDNLTGGLGDDVIYGDPTGPVFPGRQQVSTVVFADAAVGGLPADNDLLDAGDTYTVTLDGVDYTYTANGEDSTDDAGLDLAAQIDALNDFAATYDVNTNTLTVTGAATANDVLTGNTIALGESFTVSADVQNYAGVAEQTTVTIAAGTYDAGDVVRVTIDATNYDYTVVAGDTNENIASGLAALIGTGTAVNASVSSNVLTLTHDSVGIPFTVTSSVIELVPTAQVVTVDFNSLDLTDSVTISYGGNSSTVVFSDNDGTPGLSAGDFTNLVNAIGAEFAGLGLTGVTVGGANAGAQTFTITGAAAGTAFTAPGFAVTPAGSASVVLTTTGVTVHDNTDPVVLETVAAQAAGAIPNGTDVTSTPVTAVLATQHDGQGAGDVINGGEGNNHLYGMIGDDTITAGSGDNLVEGGVGNDTITLGNGSNEVDGGDGDDTITSGLTGLNLVDGNDTVDGGAGDDSITLGGGDDTVLGGDGDDTIDTGAGNDTVTGGLGADQLNGGAGSDTFAYNAEAESTGAGLAFDTIHGFTTGVGGDVLDLTGISDASVLFDGSVTFLGNFENENVANTAIDVSVTDALEVVFVSYGVAGEGWIYADTNQSGGIDTTDLAIKVVGIVGGDFTNANFTGGPI